MKIIVKYTLIVLTGLVVILASSYFFLPEFFFDYAWGQRIFLKLEGEDVAHLYYQDDQQRGDSIYMKGVIYSNTLNDITEAFDANPQITTLIMVDVPGSIDDEINLQASLEIRKRHINTYVPDNGMIASGGTDMFLAGERRAIHSTAKVGVHSWGGGDTIALEYPRDHKEHKKYLDYYRRINIPTKFYWYTLEAAPAEDIHWMTIQEITTYNVVTTSIVDINELLGMQKKLASDAFLGRRAGDNHLAQELITAYFEEIPLERFNDSYQSSFLFADENTGRETEGKNIIGYIKGTTYPDKYLVIGAHYDHLGIINDEIYHGADDNASGTSALLVLAKYFDAYKPEHSMIFAAFDAEEQGHHGSKHFVENPPVEISKILVNFNFDMISRNSKNEIYVVGTLIYPQLKPLIEKASFNSPLMVSYGHDDPDDKTKDYWMESSDNASFFEKDIPNITFSVEDHRDYHKPTDHFENIDSVFYRDVVQLIVKSLEMIDENFPGVNDTSSQ